MRLWIVLERREASEPRSLQLDALTRTPPPDTRLATATRNNSLQVCHYGRSGRPVPVRMRPMRASACVCTGGARDLRVLRYARARVFDLYCSTRGGETRKL